MIDIHCHILPGLDDGPATIEEAVAMAEAAIADGITHVVATPHASNEFPFDYARVQRKCADLQARLAGRLMIAVGCDFHLNPENLAALKSHSAPYCLNQRDCLLVEFSEFSIPPAVDQALHELQLSGLRPIVTHPERNGILRAKPERLRNWVRQGCYAQVTAGALTGGFGPGSKRDVEDWIAQGLIHFVASDAHNTRNRPLQLRPAYEAVVQHFGEETARALFIENPRAAYEGLPLPYVPEVIEDGATRRRKRFFFF